MNVSGLASGVVQIGTGANYTCALTESGGVKCWGLNNYGQLGDGTTSPSLTPVNVSGLTNGMVQIGTGAGHACALTESGGIKCWGLNDYGQLGDGTKIRRWSPVNVSLISGVVQISTGSGYQHTCALTDSGSVKCWGFNEYGQLGDGTTTNRTMPVNVSGLTSGVVQISAGYYHTCALIESGVKCWGDNNYGQLGDGTTTQRVTPVDVSGLTSGVIAVPGVVVFLDSDGDGIPNGVDTFPNDPSEWADTDGDGTGDNSDAFPSDPTEWVDTDGDDVGDNSDFFPNDPSEWTDTDNDGVGDNSDAFPSDPTEWADSDGDGLGNNSDNAPDAFNPDQSDLDGDGIADVIDPCPYNENNTCDSEGSTATYIDADTGGTMETPDGSVSVTLPEGAASTSGSVSITDTDNGASGFELTTNHGKILGVSSVDFQPPQTFNVPVAITFSWDDADNDGIVDNTNFKEENLIVTRDNQVLTGKCKDETPDGILPDCDMAANTFTFETDHWSEFALAYVSEPVLGEITAPLAPVNINDQPIAVSASFTDLDDDDTHSATWDWGDGTTSSGNVDQGNNVASGNHNYTQPGVYTVKLALSDSYPNTAEAVFQYVVVYDPDGGFVTGGGWIDSPVNADYQYMQNGGKATFGFVAKYKKGTTVPDGNTEFQFKAGDLNFKSTTYEWLVVAGNKAQFKGEGSINGAGSYKFMIFADDDVPDTFRIKIWYEENGVEFVVYDNGSQQPLGGGSIVVHTK